MGLSHCLGGRSPPPGTSDRRRPDLSFVGKPQTLPPGRPKVGFDTESETPSSLLIWVLTREILTGLIFGVGRSETYFVCTKVSLSQIPRTKPSCVRTQDSGWKQRGSHFLPMTIVDGSLNTTTNFLNVSTCTHTNVHTCTSTCTNRYTCTHIHTRTMYVRNTYCPLQW